MAFHLQLLTPGHYLVHSDNAGVVTIVNKGHSQSAHTNNVLCRIYHLQLEAHISLKAIYVESRTNVVGALFHGDITGFFKGFPQASDKTTFPLTSHLASHLLLF
jgi:hypothetical protein